MYQCGWDRFDIVAAHYCYCAQWHSGQWSEEYRRLCKIAGYTRNMPSNLAELANFSENAVWIYLSIVEREHPSGLKHEETQALALLGGSQT